MKNLRVKYFQNAQNTDEEGVGAFNKKLNKKGKIEEKDNLMNTIGIIPSDTINPSANLQTGNIESGKKNYSMSGSYIQRQDSKIKRKDKIFKNHKDLDHKYGKYTLDQLKNLRIRQRRLLIFMDCFCALTDIAVVTWLYIDHFNWVNNKYITTTSSDINKSICLILSLFVCLLIAMRFFEKSKYENLKYILNMRSTVVKKKINPTYLFLEIFIHVIQPYPKLTVNWQMIILGQKVTYSLNMILFSIGLLRLYVCLKIIKYWYTYTNDKSKRIFKFFQNKNHNMFFYKTAIKAYGFFAVIIIFTMILYLSSLVFKVFEHYSNKDDNNHFKYILNCLWYLAQTMTTSNNRIK